MFVSRICLECLLDKQIVQTHMLKFGREKKVLLKIQSGVKHLESSVLMGKLSHQAKIGTRNFSLSPSRAMSVKHVNSTQDIFKTG